MVGDYVKAGFAKIHLDASMPCADDPPALPPEEVARRAAKLCEAAESAVRSDGSLQHPCYVIGSEVPAPGGMDDGRHAPRVTEPRDASAAIDAFRLAFADRSLTDAWRRVWAVVVQPGVEFSDEKVFEYQPAAASRLVDLIRGLPDLVFEAHSTDYQPAAALRAMVRDQFAILKVGPALTFALRQALFALERIELEWLGGRRGIRLSGLTSTLMSALEHDRSHWRRYYVNGGRETVGAVLEGRLDRVRYYWTVPQVDRALKQLFKNLETSPAPADMVMRHLPVLSEKIATGADAIPPRAIVLDALTSALADYHRACTPE
jgi:D-tagatose-1,6-bisphosphate aldolase subunit GatZ/KbaZ